MEITRTDGADETVLALAGKMDATASLVATKKVLEAVDAGKNVVLDFSGVTYISSAGLRALLVGDKSARASMVTLTMRAMSPEVLQVLRLTGFDRLFTIV